MSGRRPWLVRGLLLFVLAFANLNDIRDGSGPAGEAPGLWSPDVLPSALFAWTVIRERNVDYDEFVDRANRTGPQSALGSKLDSQAYFFRACGVSTATQAPTAKRSAGGEAFGAGVKPAASSRTRIKESMGFRTQCRPRTAGASC